MIMSLIINGQLRGTALLGGQLPPDAAPSDDGYSWFAMTLRKKLIRRSA